ncbi:hypothetical protein HD806DRAFT_545264 [Xylariaceae sp. AK1471]|nr:hypothetical protein HD806DRAFT_545264 [Xylariaceae sp. AK1471]
MAAATTAHSFNTADSVNPSKFPRGMYYSLEVEPFWLEFEAKIPDLFSAGGNCRVGIVEYLSTTNCARQQTSNVAEYQGNGNAIRSISSLEELNALLGQTSTSPPSRAFFLYRFNSWSRMDITIEMFQTLYAVSYMTPQFLKIVMGLGRKMGSRDENFMSSYSQFSSQEGRRQMQQEPDREPILGQSGICYNIRHFECHGRSLEDPWSCRQSAIHQTYNMDEDRSSWIIIHPPLRFTDNMRGDYLSDSYHPMYLHLHYLSAGVGGWREYLNYLSSSLKALNEEIVICKPYGDFRISFSSKQQVHALRLKLHHARSILANTLNTIRTIRTHEETMAKLCNLSLQIQQSFQRELQNIANELENHEQTIQELLSISNDVGLMYDDVLKYHGQELLHSNSLRLTQIAQNDANETRAMAVLADKTSQDSRTMRIATVIAMFYLPANLVTSFFSTTLIWFENTEKRNLTLRIRSETWIAVLTTLVLVAGTKFLSWWWERRERERERENQRTASVRLGSAKLTDTSYVA